MAVSHNDTIVPHNEYGFVITLLDGWQKYTSGEIDFQGLMLGALLYPLDRIQSVQQVQTTYSSPSLRNSTAIVSEAIHYGRKSYFRGFAPFITKTALLTASAKLTDISSSSSLALWTAADNLSLGFGMLGYLVLYPLERVSLQMGVQVEQRRLYGNARECLAKIKKNQGLKSLYRGFFLGSALFVTQLTSIKYALKQFHQNQSQLSELQKTAALLGLVGASELLLYPLHTLKKLYQINGAVGHTDSNFSILRAVQANSLLSLFRGLGTRAINLSLFCLLYCVYVAEE